MTKPTMSAVKLGLMPPLSGLVESYGEEILRAGQIACQEINEAGGVVNQHPKLTTYLHPKVSTFDGDLTILN